MRAQARLRRKEQMSALDAVHHALEVADEVTLLTEDDATPKMHHIRHLDDKMVVEESRHSESDAPGEESLSTDSEITLDEVNEHLEDLFENEDSKDDEHQNTDLSEPEESPNDFPDLLEQLRRLRQSL